MVSLEHLDVSHNSLHHLAPQLSSLVRLTHLEATDNKLHQSTAVPEELVTLTALKVGGGQAQHVECSNKELCNSPTMQLHGHWFERG